MRHTVGVLRALAVLALSGTVIVLGGCGDAEDARPASPALPSGSADIMGVIQALHPGSATCAVTLSVVADPAAAGEYDRADIAVTGRSTVWAEAQDGVRSLTVDDLSEGQTVAVWFAGPVRESYPVQAMARSVEILTPLE